MNFKTEIDTSNHAYAIYKIKRLSKILAVCAGMVNCEHLASLLSQ